jgi:putative sigma-54 modulation protein
MRLELTGRHITITAGMRRTVQRHLARLERLLAHNALSAQIVVIHEKSKVRVEITLHARADHFFHGEGIAADWERALAAAIEKIERQAQKLTDKWKTQKRRNGAVRTAAPVPGVSQADGADSRVRIIRARRYAVKPMPVDDAALEVGDDRNAFLVFRNASNDAVTVLYRRPDGNLGLIEPEA